MYYEKKKHDGTLPLVGVNTLPQKDRAGDSVTENELIRSTSEEKSQQIRNGKAYETKGNELPQNRPEPVEE